MQQQQIIGTITRIAAILAAIILLQTLYFKFTGAAESIYIFTAMQMEPWGRYLVGSVELVAGTMLLVRPLSAWGGLLAVGTMAGAIAGHLTVLGIEVQGDGGYLFWLAVVVMVCGAWVAWRERETLIVVWQRFMKK